MIIVDDRGEKKEERKDFTGNEAGYMWEELEEIIIRDCIMHGFKTDKTLEVDILN